LTIKFQKKERVRKDGKRIKAKRKYGGEGRDILFLGEERASCC
jgi:hypothetical protein